MKILIIFAILTLITFHTKPKESPRVLQSANYTTSQTRGATVSNFCNKRMNRQQLFQRYASYVDIPYGDGVNKVFDLDTSFIDDAMNNDWTQFGNKMKAAGGRFFVFIGAWVIGLAVALILIPFLICCICCPFTCPPCGRSNETKPYTKCQLVWPTLVSLILLLIIIVTCIIGVATSYKAVKSYDYTACGAGIIIDDLINGNVSLKNSSMYFTGLKTIQTQLKTMSQNETELNWEVTKLSSSSSQVIDVKTIVKTAKTSTAQIPTPQEGSLSLTYRTPIGKAPEQTTGFIYSYLPDILGNKSSPSSLVNTAYSTLVNFQSALSNMVQAADSYGLNTANFRASIDTSLNQTSRQTKILQDKDAEINDFFNNNRSLGRDISIGEYVYYGLLLGLSIIMMLPLSCMINQGGKGFRYFMHGICVFLYLLCIVSFVYCIFVSILNPVIYYTCQYIQENLDSKTKLNETLVNRLDIPADVSANLVECLAIDGRGEIATKILGQDVQKSLSSLRNVYSSLDSLTHSQALNQMTVSHEEIYKKIQSYKKNQLIDIEDLKSISQLINLSRPYLYTCDSYGFWSDSWVPSINVKEPYLGCYFDIYGYSNSTTCKNSADFESRASGCTGCMDTSTSFSETATRDDVLKAMQARYKSQSCNTFNTELANVWANFYKTKIDVLNPVLKRSATATNNSNNVVESAKYFTSVQNNLNSNFSTILNSQYGLVSGLNCKVAGQDFALLKNVVCRRFFLYTYFTRIVFGILSFALLFLMCCVTCASRRNRRQMQFTNPNQSDPYLNFESEKNPIIGQSLQNIQNSV